MTSIRWFGVAALSCLVIGLLAFGATGPAAADTTNQVGEGCGTLQLDVIDTQGKVTGPFTYVIEETHSNKGIIPRSPYVPTRHRAQTAITWRMRCTISG